MCSGGASVGCVVAAGFVTALAPPAVAAFLWAGWLDEEEDEEEDEAAERFRLAPVLRPVMLNVLSSSSSSGSRFSSSSSSSFSRSSAPYISPRGEGEGKRVVS
jgi:hypothetical protein